MIEHPNGLEISWGPFTVFFGNRHAQLLSLQQEFPALQFLRVKQVHGHVIHEVGHDFQDFAVEGDGLISNRTGTALCSISADCMPVLMAAPDIGWFGSFHAGWRGVAARIVPKGIEALIKKGASPEKLRLWIGPHILQDSFEVEADVRDQILAALPEPTNSPTLFYYEDRPGKFKFSLLQVVLEQVAALDVPLENVEMELDDTLTNEQFHSARRDKEKSGRQISWIAKR